MSDKYTLCGLDQGSPMTEAVWTESSVPVGYSCQVASYQRKDCDEHGTFNFVKKTAAARITDKHYGWSSLRWVHTDYDQTVVARTSSRNLCLFLEKFVPEGQNGSLVVVSRNVIIPASSTSQFFRKAFTDILSNLKEGSECHEIFSPVRTWSSWNSVHSYFLAYGRACVMPRSQ